jgi:hypothetical protein
MDDVLIEESRTSRLRLLDSELRAVTVRGRIDSLFLIDSVVDGLDLSGADVASLSIVSSDLRRVLFPQRTDCFVVSGPTIARSEPALAGSLSPDGRRKYGIYAEMAYGLPVKPFMFGREVLSDFSSGDRDIIVEALFAMAIDQWPPA